MHAPLVIAHRGDSSNAVENSLEAVNRALALPVDMIEIDIRKSRDGKLFVIHDKNTGRTADRDIDIEKSTFNEVARVKLKNGEPIPTIEDVLRVVSGTVGLNIEIKSIGAGPLLAEILIHSRYPGHVFVSSFMQPEVVALRQALPDVPVSIIYDSFSPRYLSRYAGEGYRILSLRKNSATQDLIAGCHALGMQVFAWTVDDEDEMKQFIRLGVDGIYSNRPALLKTIVEQHRVTNS